MRFGLLPRAVLFPPQMIDVPFVARGPTADDYWAVGAFLRQVSASSRMEDPVYWIALLLWRIQRLLLCRLQVEVVGFRIKVRQKNKF